MLTFMEEGDGGSNRKIAPEEHPLSFIRDCEDGTASPR